MQREEIKIEGKAKVIAEGECFPEGKDDLVFFYPYLNCPRYRFITRMLVNGKNVQVRFSFSPEHGVDHIEGLVFSDPCPN